MPEAAPLQGLNELEAYLRAAEILTWGEVVPDGSHPEKHRIVLAGGVQAIAKPGHDQYEPMVMREAAGWQVAKHLGFPGLVAGTVLRAVPRLSTGSDVISSIQVTWPDSREWVAPLERFSPDETFRAAVFDAVVAHTDHNVNNWFGVPSGDETHLRLVDTGNAFGVGGAAVNSSFYDHHLDEPLPEDVLVCVRRMCEGWPIGLDDLLGPDEASRVLARARELAESETLRVV
jgi:hypothetical protein